MTFSNQNLITKSHIPVLGKRKLNLIGSSLTKKVNIEPIEREIGKFLRNYLTLTIPLMVRAAFMARIF